MKCLRCERPITADPNCPNNPSGAGEVVVSFHYGSRWDQCDGIYPPQPVDPTKERHISLLRSCRQIVGYLCDDCFVVHSDLLSGFNGREKLL
jgi:hypothetical protein